MSNKLSDYKDYKPISSRLLLVKEPVGGVLIAGGLHPGQVALLGVPGRVDGRDALVGRPGSADEEDAEDGADQDQSPGDAHD